MNDDNFGTLIMMFDPTTIINDEEKGETKEFMNGFIMPREMHPTKEAFEKLGFVFKDIPGDDVLCYGALPEGWSIRPTDQSTWHDIVDENGITRGDMFYRASSYDRDAHMKLFCRYRVRREIIDGETEIFFGNETEKLFVAGRVKIDFDASREEVESQFERTNMLIMKAQKFADENYPDWENVHAYWNDNKKVKCLKR